MLHCEEYEYITQLLLRRMTCYFLHILEHVLTRPHVLRLFGVATILLNVTLEEIRVRYPCGWFYRHCMQSFCTSKLMLLFWHKALKLGIILVLCKSVILLVRLNVTFNDTHTHTQCVLMNLPFEQKSWWNWPLDWTNMNPIL